MKNNILILSFMCILFIIPAYGEEKSPDSDDIIIPHGMEVIKKGDVNLVVYKGDQLRKQGDVIMTETTDEYASRKFSDTEEHLKKIEKELGDLKSAVKKLEEDGRKK